MVNEKIPIASMYIDKPVPQIIEIVVKPQQAEDISFNWTNNISESLNHIIKQAVLWKSQSLYDLVVILYELVQ